MKIYEEHSYARPDIGYGYDMHIRYFLSEDIDSARLLASGRNGVRQVSVDHLDDKLRAAGDIVSNIREIYRNLG